MSFCDDNKDLSPYDIMALLSGDIDEWHIKTRRAEIVQNQKYALYYPYFFRLFSERTTYQLVYHMKRIRFEGRVHGRPGEEEALRDVLKTRPHIGLSDKFRAQKRIARAARNRQHGFVKTIKRKHA